MPNTSTSIVYTAPQVAGNVLLSGNLGGSLANVGLSAYAFYKSLGQRDRFTQAEGTANLINAIAGIFVPAYAAIQGIANIQMRLAHDYFSKQAAKHQARRDLRNIGFAFAKYTGAGHNPIIAARMAAFRRGVDPEAVFPLGSPFANYSPRTGASDTEAGLLLDFGEGPAADAAREVEGEIIRRPFPGQGLLPPYFVRLRKAA